MSRSLLTCLLGATLVSAAVPAAAQNRMSPELLWQLGRVSGGSLDPSGKTLLYGVRRYELSENKGDTDLWLVDLEGGEPRQLTSGPVSEGAVHWVETEAGMRLFHLASRGDEEDATPQVWSLDPSTGNLLQVTDVEGGVANLKVSPTGDRIAFTVDVKLDQTVNDVFPDLPMADARIIDGLMYRHWNQWHDFKYSHVCTAPIQADGTAGEMVDLMKGMRVDCPVPPFGGSEQFAFSSDGKHIAVTMKIAANWAESTDSNVYLRPADGSGSFENLTAGMHGYDNNPVFADGLLYIQSMERPGFEADRNRIMEIDLETRSMIELTEGLDQTTHGVTVSPDGASLYFQSEWRGTDQIFRLDRASKTTTQVTKGQYNYSLRDITPDGKTLVLARQSMVRPWELGTQPAAGGEWKALTDVNGAIFKDLELPTVEARWTRSTDGESVHSWVIYPPGFDKDKQYPMLTYFQGGPQGQIGQWFSFRWNFHLMAAHGEYVIVAPNRRGLPGFGRKWNDDISKDWGGQAMQDILAVHDSMIAEPYIDPARVGGIGASFGGYTAYWMMGNAAERFAAIISHCGLFNLESMYGSTEELFFVNWDVGGPYWRSEQAQASYDKFSPHRYVRSWKTPLLVIHGEKDFRVPITQGIEAFQAAQIEGVPSRFLYFPTEGHWVQSPQNGVVWHRVFFEWLEEHVK